MGRWRRWLAPGALAVVSVVSGALALVDPWGGRAPGPSGKPVPASLAAPVLSLRRAPESLAQVVAEVRLRAGLAAALAPPASGGTRGPACLVVREGGRQLFRHQPDEALIPASTLKILTAAATLARIDPDERLETQLRADRPVVGGVVDGPLWLVGGGDPVLATADYASTFRHQPHLYTPLERLADAVVAAGVRQVSGGVLGDESRFDEQRYLPSWKPSYATSGQVGPAGSLVVNDGFVAFRPAPVAAPEPAVHAAEVLTDLLHARGVVVGGAPGEGEAPKGSIALASVPSPTMGDVVGDMLRESDNLTAELIVKELGHRFGGGGSTAAGIEVVRQALEEAGLDVSALRAVDGSGLDRSDRASCRLLVEALTKAAPEPAAGSDARAKSGAGAGIDDPLASGLAVAARSGTLAERFHGHPAAGRLRAKTGSLEGVSGLVGFVERPGGGPLEFALLANDLPSEAAGRALQEQVASVLAVHPDVPPVEQLAP